MICVRLQLCAAGSPYLRARTHASLNYAVVRFVRFFQNTLPLFFLTVVSEYGKGKGNYRGNVEAIPPHLPSIQTELEREMGNDAKLGPIFKHRSGKEEGRETSAYLLYVNHVPLLILSPYMRETPTLYQIYNSDSHLHLPINE